MHVVFAFVVCLMRDTLTLLLFVVCSHRLAMKAKQRKTGNVLKFLDPTVNVRVSLENHTDYTPFKDVFTWTIVTEFNQICPISARLNFRMNIDKMDAIPEIALQRAGTFAGRIRHVEFTPDAVWQAPKEARKSRSGPIVPTVMPTNMVGMHSKFRTPPSSTGASSSRAPFAGMVST